MAAEIRIRQANEADTQQLGRILIESAAWHQGLDPRYYRVPGEEDARRRIRGFLADPQRTLLVAEQDDTLVGFVEIIAMPSPEAGSMVRPRRAAEVGIAVGAEHRDRGVGHRLMEAAEVLAADQGAELLTLSVQADNERAIHLYASTGYRIVGHSMAKWLSPT